MSDTPASKQPSFADRVNNVVATMTQAEDGSWAVPAEAGDLDEATLFAVTTERRRRDTQASFSKGQAELARIKAENDKLAKAWGDDVASTLTASQQDELDELKATDPDAWRTKITAYEQENANTFKTKRDSIAKEANDETEVDRRVRVMAEFNEANPGFELTDEIVENDLPPRFIKQLEKGDISFEDFLVKAATFLGAPKKLSEGETAPTSPNLSKVGGGHTPSPDAVNRDIVGSYSKETY